MRGRRSGAEKEQKNSKIKEFPWLNALVCLAVLTSLCAIVFAARVYRHEQDLAASREEMAALPVLPETPEIIWSSLGQYVEKMQAINPDYVGSIRIGNTGINYPVVRGSDNEKYLHTSFEGIENTFGALFMDYRCVGEDLPHLIIYGHHAGDMEGNKFLFGWLDGFLDEENLEKNSVITFYENGSLSEFEVFSARMTDIDDPAYQLNFSEADSFVRFLEGNRAPADAEQILTLSTCVGSGENDMRLIVQGVRRTVQALDDTQVMIASY